MRIVYNFYTLFLTGTGVREIIFKKVQNLSRCLRSCQPWTEAAALCDVRG
jgi:hypothetical protein